VRGWQDAVADPKRGATLAVTKYGKSFNLDQHAQELIAAKIAPLVATPETEKNGLFTMSKAGIDANIAAIKAVGVDVNAVIAIGDGANDLDMLSAAGMGIAYNAKPVVQQAAQTSVNVPYLDAIMYLLGISREEIVAADAEAGIVTPAPPV